MSLTVPQPLVLRMPFSCEFPPLLHCWACLHLLPPVGLVVLYTPAWNTAPLPFLTLPLAYFPLLPLTQGVWWVSSPYWNFEVGEQVTIGQTWENGASGFLILDEFCVASSCGVFDWLPLLISAACQILGPLSCLFVSLAHPIFLYTFTPGLLSIAEFMPPYAPLPPYRPHLQSLVFLIWEGLCNISDFPKQGQFYFQMKFRCQLLKSHFPPSFL